MSTPNLQPLLANITKRSPELRETITKMRQPKLLPLRQKKTVYILISVNRPPITAQLPESIQIETDRAYQAARSKQVILGDIMGMEIDERQKLYGSFADISRRWTAVMDAKAAFLSALNGGLLAFLWGSAKVADWDIVAKAFATGATAMALVALLLALWTISPRERLSSVVGKKSRWEGNYQPVSFYSYVAKRYGQDEFNKMEADLAHMDAAEFAHEALEQHFNISHVIQAKSEKISFTAKLTALAIALTTIGLYFRCMG